MRWCAYWPPSRSMWRMTICRTWKSSRSPPDRRPLVHIGAPKEIKTHEYRVGLTPAGVRELVTHGHRVTVEHNAAAGIGIPDDVYRAAGAAVGDTAAEVFAIADLIGKVKEPQPAEIAMLRQAYVLFTYLHLSADKAQT